MYAVVVVGRVVISTLSGWVSISGFVCFATSGYITWVIPIGFTSWVGWVSEVCAVWKMVGLRVDVVCVSVLLDELIA